MIAKLRGERAEALLADQKREAEQPRSPSISSDPRFRNRPPFSSNPQQLDERIEQIIDVKIATALAAENEKRKKAEEKAAPERKNPAPNP
jgi:hypothetical protein